MLKIPEAPNPKLDEGSWTEYRGAKFLIAHAESDRFQRRMQALEKPFRRKIERNEMDPADRKRLLTRALGETVLLNWEGVETPYSKEASVRWLQNDPELRNFVMEFSTDLQNFREEETELEGNS
jgi:hypothetical protein